MQGECGTPPPNGYNYPADFGGPEAFAQSQFVAPFACGGTIISIRHGLTQARDLVTGARLGSIPGPARRGSGCLDDRRAVLVGKKDIRIVAVPSLQRQWSNAPAGPIATAALCGTKLVVILEGSSDPVLVDLPPAPAGKAPLAPTRLRPR